LPGCRSDASIRSVLRPIAAAAILVLALVACAGSARELRSDEARLVAWWIEDVAHGRPRDPAELATTDASAPLDRVRDWLRGTRTAAGAWRAPPRLHARLTRWPVVRALLHRGIVVLAGDGLIAVDPRATPGDRALAQTLVDAENDDRRVLETTVLSVADAGSAATRRLRVALAQARAELASQAGGKRY
jgi:hypothetical protein